MHELAGTGSVGGNGTGRREVEGSGEKEPVRGHGDDKILPAPALSPAPVPRQLPEVKGFEDLVVYRESYAVMIRIYRELLPILPQSEKYDLCDQIRRSTKAIPRLIAEGHSKRHQFRGFHKYIDDAKAESNELIVSLSQVKDLYADKKQQELCQLLIREYDKISRRLYNLGCSWTKYHQENRLRNRQ